MPAARREARVPNKQVASRTLSGLLESRASSATFSVLVGMQGGDREEARHCRAGRQCSAGGQARAGSGQQPGNRAGLFLKRRSTPWNLPGWGPRPLKVPAQTPQKTHKHPNDEGFGVLLYCLTARGQWRGWVTTGLVYREASPSLTVLTRRSAGGLGRSLERPC